MIKTNHPILKVDCWNCQSRLIHGFTTKSIADDLVKITEATLSQSHNIVTLKQTHSTDVILVEEDFIFSSTIPLEGDALLTNRTDCVLAVRTADCMPWLVFDPVQNVVGAVHAGHQGLRKGILKNTIQRLKERYNSRPEDQQWALGPSISLGCFEVGNDFLEDSKNDLGLSLVYDQTKSKPHIDLKSTAKAVLKGFKVKEENVHDINLCTFSNTEMFYSYRRDKQSGRQLSFIGLR